jgi:hypothetical protein
MKYSCQQRPFYFPFPTINNTNMIALRTSVLEETLMPLNALTLNFVLVSLRTMAPSQYSILLYFCVCVCAECKIVETM